MPIAKRTSIISGSSNPPPPCCMKDRNALRAGFIGLVTFSPSRQRALCRGLPAPPFHYHLHVDQSRVYPDDRPASLRGAYSFRPACSFPAWSLQAVLGPLEQHLQRARTRVPPRSIPD